MMASDECTDEEKAAGRRKFAEKRAGIDVPVEQPKPPSMKEQFEQNTYTDEATGEKFAKGKDGTFKSIQNPAKERAAEAADGSYT